MPSRVSGFRRVICLVHCIHHCIMCIASCIMSFLFLTQLNKWHGSLIHLNRGSSHGKILFITYKSLLLLLGNYIINIPLIWNHQNTLASNSPGLCYLTSWPQTLSINSFITFPISTKIPNILDFSNTPFLFKSIWIKFKWIWIQFLQSCQFIFSVIIHIFVSPGK